MADVESDLAESGALEQAPAGPVLGEELADELVDPLAFGGRGQLVEESAPDSLRTGGPGDVEAALGDAVVAVGGEFGTLSEIGFALKLGRPVVGLTTWELARRGEPVTDAIVVADDPVAAAARAVELAGP